MAPRHKEKFEYFASQLEKYEIPFERRLSQKQPTNSAVLVDRMGELEQIYSFTALAFIGGSIVNFGGHNPLEASAYAVPVAMGNYRQAVFEVCEQLEHAGGIVTVQDEQQALDLIERLLSSPQQFKQIGEQGQSVWQSAQGAVGRIVDALSPTHSTKASSYSASGGA